MPLNSTRVIPDGWSEHHSVAANGFLTGVCTISEPGEVEGEYPDLVYVPGPVHYDGPGSAQRQADGADTVSVGATETVRSYLVSIVLKDAPVIKRGQSSYLVEFTKCPDDPDLVGRVLKVVDVQHGTTNWTRDLVCTEVAADERTSQTGS